MRDTSHSLHTSPVTDYANSPTWLTLAIFLENDQEKKSKQGTNLPTGSARCSRGWILGLARPHQPTNVRYCVTDCGFKHGWGTTSPFDLIYIILKSCADMHIRPPNCAQRGIYTEAVMVSNIQHDDLLPLFCLFVYLLYIHPGSAKLGWAWSCGFSCLGFMPPISWNNAFSWNTWRRRLVCHICLPYLRTTPARGI